MSVALFKIVDGDAAGHVGGGAVNFGWVFTRVTTTTDGDSGAVIINDQFAAGEAGVGIKATLVPVAGGVNVKLQATF